MGVTPDDVGVEWLEGGREPYSFDFGDAEYGEWLREHLSVVEYGERDRWWTRYCAVTNYALPWWARGLLYPWRRYYLRRAYAFDARARSRGGEPPGPSWKIRHEFGVAAGEARR